MSSVIEARLEHLREAYASGVLETRFEGRLTRFQSMRELRDAIRDLERQLRKPPMAGFASFSRGDG